jgi:hypothetical protein
VPKLVGEWNKWVWPRYIVGILIIYHLKKYMVMMMQDYKTAVSITLQRSVQL